MQINTTTHPDSGNIKVYVQFMSMGESFKMRGWCEFAWAFLSHNRRKCKELQLQQVELIKPTCFFDFSSTHAILTP